MRQAANGLNRRMRPANGAKKAECGRPQMGEIAGCGLRTEQRGRNAAGRKWAKSQDAACEQSKESRMRQAANG